MHNLKDLRKNLKDYQKKNYLDRNFDLKLII